MVTQVVNDKFRFAIFGILLTLFSFPNWALGQQDPSFAWGRHFGGSNGEWVADVVTDSKGNVYATGKFEGTVDFDPSSAISNLTANGKQDLYITKFSPQGKFRWAINIGGSQGDFLSRITVDSFDKILLVGGNRNYDFDPTSGVQRASSSSGGYVAKYDTNANLIWVKSIGGTEAYNVATDAAGGIYLCGGFTGTSDFDPGSGTYNLKSNGSGDVFVSKLDSSGKLIWAKSVGSSNREDAYSIAVDADLSVYTCGRFRGSVDFDPGSGTNRLTASGYDAFLLKLDSVGNFKWARNVADKGTSFADGLSVDDSNNVLMSGSFSRFCDFDPGAGIDTTTGNLVGTAYLIKYDSAGNYKWAYRPKTFTRSRAFFNESDPSGNHYVIGEFRGKIDFNLGVSGYELTADGRDDVFLVKLTSKGKVNWLGHLTSTSYGSAIALHVDRNMSIYAGGWFYGTIDLDTDTSSYKLTSAGKDDAYIVKFDQCKPSKGSSKVAACDSFLAPGSSTAWKKSGLYKYTLQNKAGCDSVVTLELTVLKKSDSTLSITTCDSFISPSSSYTWFQSGVYSDTVMNAIGCDSIITVNLTVNLSQSTSVSAQACDSYTSPSGQYTWTNTGVYHDTLTTTNGCDSVVEISLSILKSTSGTVSPTVCDSLVSPSGLYTWYSSGIYYDTSVNTVGCDSIITVNATIHQTKTSTQQMASCGPFQAPSGKVLSTTGTYLDTINTVQGCDSIITIQLEVNTPSSSSISPSTCSVYTSPSGKYVWTANGTYTDTIPNTKGCDSVITINLTVVKVNASITAYGDSLVADASPAQYQWLNCDAAYTKLGGENNRSFVPSASGNYAVEVTQNGCSDTSVCYDFIVNTTGEKREMLFTLYPNPNDGTFRINTTSQSGRLQLNIYNSLGRQIKNMEVDGNASNTVNLHASSGIYLVELVGVDGHHAFQRLIIR